MINNSQDEHVNPSYDDIYSSLTQPELQIESLDQTTTHQNQVIPVYSVVMKRPKAKSIPKNGCPEDQDTNSESNYQLLGAEEDSKELPANEFEQLNLHYDVVHEGGFPDDKASTNGVQNSNATSESNDQLLEATMDLPANVLETATQDTATNIHYDTMPFQDAKKVQQNDIYD